VELVVVVLITVMLPRQRSEPPEMLRAHRLAPLGRERQLVGLLALLQPSEISRTPQAHPPLRLLFVRLLALQQLLVLEELAQVPSSLLAFSGQ